MRWRGWRTGTTVVVCAALGAVVCAAVGGAATPAKFPGKLYTYVEDLSAKVTRQDFSGLAREVEAVQRALGVNLSNLPPESHCFWLQGTATAPILSNERFNAVWTAPTDGAIIEITGEIFGGTSVLADLGIRHAQQSPVSVNGANLSFVPGGIPPQAVFSGQTNMLKGDRLDVALGQVSGVPTSATICWLFARTGK